MSLQKEDEKFVECIESLVELDDSNSKWIKTADVAEKAGVDESAVVKISRRLRVKKLLAERGISCTPRREALFIWK